jgi:hypothetical protein
LTSNVAKPGDTRLADNKIICDRRVRVNLVILNKDGQDIAAGAAGATLATIAAVSATSALKTVRRTTTTALLAQSTWPAVSRMSLNY